MKLIEANLMDVFIVGDLVQLRSGGPVMTVDEIEKCGIWTCWFAYGRRHRNRFAANALHWAEAPQTKPFGTGPGAGA